MYQHCPAIPAFRRFRLAIVILSVTLLLNSTAFAEQITLNLKDADIRALIDTVARHTGKNFVVDPRVKGKVTVVSAKPMNADEVYEVFLSVLQVHGFSVVPVGSVIKIVPEVNAKQGPLPVATRGRPGSGDQLVTRVVQLSHVPAAQLVPILRPLVPQQGHLAAYNPTNTLILTDYAGNISRLLKIIADVDQPGNDELEIIRLEHASATELVRILSSLQAGTAKGGAQANTLTLAADDRTNSILMSGDRTSRMKTRAIISQLDTPLDSGGNTHVIYLRYANANDMVAILSDIQEFQAATGDGGANKPAPRSRAQDGKVNIQADETTNALIITAPPDVVSSLKAVIRQLDIRRAQVLVESIIAEITTDRAKEFGFDMAIDGRGENTEGDTSIPVGASSLSGIIPTLLSPNPTLGDGLTLGFGRDNGNRFGVLLRALASDGATNILSTPSLVTLDNEEAEIVVGENVPFVTGSFTNTGTANGAANPFQTIERRDVGITLRVTPQINEGTTIKLDLEIEASDIGASSAGAADLITNKRSTKTSVLVEDGEILVLGGLIRDTILDTQSKVPVIGDIPLLGQLFRYRNTSKRKQNLMMFLRPSILRDQQTTAWHTSRKYNYLRAQQIQAGEKGFGLLRDEKSPLLPPLDEYAPAPTRNESPQQDPNGNVQYKSMADEVIWNWDDEL